MSIKKLGKYTLLEQIAAGGMAEIHLAVANNAEGMPNFFAIKKILNAYSTNPEFVNLFKDEAKIASQLNHSNVIHIHDFGVDESNQLFIVMEHVHGRNLKQILQALSSENRKLPLELIVYIIKEVAYGLDYAYNAVDSNSGQALNIIHRDVSPQNIMVGYNGEIKIIDFGIANSAVNMESNNNGQLKGKFGYLSPEQVNGEVVDHRSDLFSLGIVMWEIIANRRLFASETEAETLNRIRQGQIPNISAFLDSKYFELADILGRCLSSDKELRYQSGLELSHALSMFLNKYFQEFNKHVFSDYLKNTFFHFYEKSQEKLDKYIQLQKVVVEDSSAKDIKNNPLETIENLDNKDGPSKFVLNWIYGSTAATVILLIYFFAFFLPNNKNVGPSVSIGTLSVTPSKKAPPKNIDIPIEAIAKIEGNGSQACIQTLNKKTFCWGDNRFHQIHSSSSNDFISLTEMTFYPSWEVLKLGQFHSCGILEGKLMCWGDNSFGQIGVPISANAAIPTSVDPNTSYKDISLGHYHTCGLTSDGLAKCWGKGDYAQLGMENIKSSKVPLTVDSKARFKTISSGSHHTCGILEDDTVRCWGRNDFGQIGNGQIYNQGTIENIDPKTRYKQISLGENHTCGITVDGEIKCWGKNEYGQLGVGHNERITKPTFTLIDRKFSKIKSGKYHTCALSEENDLYCWGRNSFYQVSTSDLNYIVIPELTSRISPNGDFLLGDLSTCFTMPGKLSCRGHVWITKSREPAQAN